MRLAARLMLIISLLSASALLTAAAPRRAVGQPAGPDYNALQPCSESAPSFSTYGPALAQLRAQLAVRGPAAAADLSDLDTLRVLRDLFALTAGGQHYISLYYRYGSETGALGVADPDLALDAYNTLQSFLPGTRALLAGQGSQVTITEGMVAQANDIFDRLSTAGSPALQSAIDVERGQYHHLQDFTGKTFAQAAALIGVDSHRLYLPLLSKP